MRICKIMILVIMLTQITFCTAMDIDLAEESKKIKLFVDAINKKENQEKQNIPFLLPLEKAYPDIYEVYPEFVKHFPQKKKSIKDKTNKPLSS